MAIFEPPSSQSREEFIGSDAASRALSVAVVENDFVERVYENIAWAYDAFFGPTLHPGRVQAIQRMAIGPRDRVLEVGVGTGINAALYPRSCSVTGIDFSGSDARKGPRPDGPQGHQQRAPARDGRGRSQVPRRHLRHRLRAVRDQRRARPGRRRARDAARLPPRRTRHRPESLPQPEHGAGGHRTRHLAVHRSHRLQVGSGSARVSRPGQPPVPCRSRR